MVVIIVRKYDEAKKKSKYCLLKIKLYRENWLIDTFIFCKTSLQIFMFLLKMPNVLLVYGISTAQT